MKTKTYNGFVVINYKSGKVRAIRHLRYIQPNEVAVSFKLTLNMPEVSDCAVITGNINVPKVDIEGTLFKVN